MPDFHSGSRMQWSRYFSHSSGVLVCHPEHGTQTSARINMWNFPGVSFLLFNIPTELLWHLAETSNCTHLKLYRKKVLVAAHYLPWSWDWYCQAVTWQLAQVLHCLRGAIIGKYWMMILQYPGDGDAVSVLQYPGGGDAVSVLQYPAGQPWSPPTQAQLERAGRSSVGRSRQSDWQ